jgi:hypothetical protein
MAQPDAARAANARDQTHLLTPQGHPAGGLSTCIKGVLDRWGNGQDGCPALHLHPAEVRWPVGKNAAPGDTPERGIQPSAYPIENSC